MIKAPPSEAVATKRGSWGMAPATRPLWPDRSKDRAPFDLGQTGPSSPQGHSALDRKLARLLCKKLLEGGQ